MTPGSGDRAAATTPPGPRAPGLLCSVRCTSRLPAAQAAVWARATTPEGINDELWPLLRMTVPRGTGGLDLARVEPPRTLGRSWLLAGGVVPVDYDLITIEELDPAGRFLERSSMLLFAEWVHERRVRAAAGDASVVEDHLSWRGRGGINRTAVARRLQTRLVGALFRHRHRRLARHFGAATDPPVVEVVAPHELPPRAGGGRRP